MTKSIRERIMKHVPQHNGTGEINLKSLYNYTYALNDNRQVKHTMIFPTYPRTIDNERYLAIKGMLSNRPRHILGLAKARSGIGTRF